MFRLSKGEILKVLRGGRVEIFRRKGGRGLSELYRRSRGRTVDALVCSGAQNKDIYHARIIISRGKKMQYGEFVYGYFITVLQIAAEEGKDNG